LVLREMGILNSLGRTLHIVQAAVGSIVPIYRAAGEVAPISTTLYLEAYLKDPSIAAAVDYLAEEAVGPGFFITSPTPRAKTLADDFNTEVGMDELAMQGAKECVFGGNSFWEKTRDTESRLVGVKLLPLQSIRRIKREPLSGRPLWYEQRFGGQTTILDPKDIVHFKYNPQGGEAFGSPVIRSLLESYVVDDRYVREPFLKIKARMEAIMPKIFTRYAAPKRVWVFPGVSDAKRDEYKQVIEQTPEDQDLAFNPAEKDSFDITNLEIDPRARFEGFINYIESQYIAGMQTPVVKLYTAPGFTEASATVAKRISELKIYFLRRFLKRVLERQIYRDLLVSNGLNPLRSPITLNWGVERPELSMADVVNFAKISAETGIAYLSREEVRKMLRKFGFELEEEPTPEPAPQPQPKEPPAQ
jgi:hypothetical protein